MTSPEQYAKRLAKEFQKAGMARDQALREAGQRVAERNPHQRSNLLRDTKAIAPLVGVIVMVGSLVFLGGLLFFLTA